MILPDHKIEAEVASGRLGINPFDPSRLQPASYDLTLDRYFRIYTSSQVIDLRSPERRTELHEVEESFVLGPLSFALASTVEHVKIPMNVTARLEGKSSLARVGVIVHVTAGFFDPGFEGYPTLELFNANNASVKLYVNMPICQMSFEMMEDYPRSIYRGKYQHQERGPVESRYYMNFDHPENGR